MKWKYIKPLKSEDVFEEFKNKYIYGFPPEFVEWVKIHNGGRPSCYCFKTKSGIERTIKCLLSLNHDDKENIWDLCDCLPDSFHKRFTPFAIDSFGNYICFDLVGAVCFVSLDPVGVDVVGLNFEDFLKKLY